MELREVFRKRNEVNIFKNEGDIQQISGNRGKDTFEAFPPLPMVRFPLGMVDQVVWEVSITGYKADRSRLSNEIGTGGETCGGSQHVESGVFVGSLCPWYRSMRIFNSVLGEVTSSESDKN